jgi:hypothetical protein
MQLLIFIHFTTGVKFKTYHNKLLYIFWIFLSLIITNHYVSDIRAILIAEKEFRIESLQQLIETDNMLIVVRNPHVHRFLNTVSNCVSIQPEKTQYLN